MSITFLFLTLLIVGVLTAFSIFQTRRILGQGSDHYVHLHLIRYSRSIRHRLFTHFPNLLNEAPLAYPLFVHVTLARFGDRAIQWCSRYLNSILVAGIIVLSLMFFHKVVSVEQLGGNLATWAALALALTPQLYSPLNARNSGLGGRAIGLVSVTVTLFSVFLFKSHENGIVAWILGTLFSYIAIGSNKFSLQTLTIFSILMGIAFNEWTLAFVFLSGMIFFFVAHFSFAKVYTRDLIEYWILYSTIMAKGYILLHRPSIWQDFIGGFRKKWSGAYFLTNPVIIILYSNPLSLFAGIIAIFNLYDITSPIMHYSAQLVLVGLSAFFLTSFRSTRFLGEPERYIEMMAPFSAFISISWILNEFEWIGASFALFILGSLMAVQNYIFVVRWGNEGTTINGGIDEYEQIGSIIDSDASGEEVRFISNSGQRVKYLLNSRWRFFYIWPVYRQIEGKDIREVMPDYPNINPQSMFYFAEMYKTNYCLWDKNLSPQNVFAAQGEKYSAKTLFDGKDYTLIKLSWN